MAEPLPAYCRKAPQRGLAMAPDQHLPDMPSHRTGWYSGARGRNRTPLASSRCTRFRPGCSFKHERGLMHDPVSRPSSRAQAVPVSRSYPCVIVGEEKSVDSIRPRAVDGLQRSAFAGDRAKAYAVRRSARRRTSAGDTPCWSASWRNFSNSPGSRRTPTWCCRRRTSVPRRGDPFGCFDMPAGSLHAWTRLPATRRTRAVTRATGSRVRL